MAIQRRTHGAATAWTTSQPIPYSTSQTAGDVCYLWALNAAAIGAAPAGWTEVAAAGPIAGYYGKLFKLARHPGGTPTAPTVTASGGSAGVAWIEHHYSDAGGTTVLRGAGEQIATDTDTSSTAFAATGTSITTAAADLILALLGLKAAATMTANPTATTVTQAGATLGTNVGNFGARLSGASPTNSLAYGSYQRPVTTGASGAPGFTATAGTGGTTAAGMVALIRLREVTNTAPVANAGPDQTGITPSTLVTLDGTGSSDADGDPITYAWTHVSGPYAGSLSSSTAAQPTYTPTASGTDVWSLTVTDLYGLASSADTVSITVTASNTAPTANAGPDQTGIEPGRTVTLDGSGSTDPDGTITGYAWSQIGGTPTVTLAGSGATRTFTAPATLTGAALTFQLVVTDNLGATSAPDTMQATILPASRRLKTDAGIRPVISRSH